jgi:hypothetical protein
MPEMDGIEATRRIRLTGYGKPIVALTANALAGNDKMFIANGFDDFISKPIDIRQLNAVLNKLVRDKQSPEIIEAARRQSTGPTTTPAEGPKANDELLTIFVRDAKKTIPIINGIYDKISGASTEDARLYVVNVHAMKSALANIGESEASALADILEKAGESGDWRTIESETARFLAALEGIVGKIESTIETNENVDSTDADVELLREKLDAISAACGDYDDITAEAVLAELKGYTWSVETKGILDKISEHILHSDFEAAAETALSATLGR